jgi:hypothetical protein
MARTFGSSMHRTPHRRKAGAGGSPRKPGAAARRVVVGLHVIGVDVGDDRQHRLQVQERGVGFVRLDDDELALPRRAFEPAPPGGRRSRRSDPCPPSASTLATRLVVVVLPCVPATAMPCLSRISSASISARGTTGMRRARAAMHLGVVVHSPRWRHDRVGAFDRSARRVRCDTRAPSARSRAWSRFVARSEPLTW